MDGPLWSFLVDLAPIRRALRREINRAVDVAWQTAQDVLDRDREQHRTALGEAEARTSGLQQRVADSEATNRGLRSELSAQKENEKRRQREQEAADAELDRNTISDLFCCQNCRSLLLLSMRPDRSYTVCGPVGGGCSTCTNEPLLRLAAVKASVTESDEADMVARPVGELPDQPADTQVPGDRLARTEIGVKFVAKLVEGGPDAAIAKTAAHGGERVRAQ
jgi:hypothetical protein